jgi:hypothetical protein
MMGMCADDNKILDKLRGENRNPETQLKIRNHTNPYMCEK